MFSYTTCLGQPRGNIAITAEEVSDSKFDIKMQLSGSNLDKKDFFGKVTHPSLFVSLYIISLSLVWSILCHI